MQLDSAVCTDWGGDCRGFAFYDKRQGWLTIFHCVRQKSELPDTTFLVDVREALCSTSYRLWGHEELDTTGWPSNSDRLVWASQVAPWAENPPAMQETQETWVQSLGWGDSLEKGLATHLSILAWRIPWTEEPDGLQSMASQSWTRLKWLSTHACAHTYTRAHKHTQGSCGEVSNFISCCQKTMFIHIKSNTGVYMLWCNYFKECIYSEDKFIKKVNRWIPGDQF